MATSMLTNSESDKQGSSLRYVLVTPARNEEVFIEQTIESVVAQTVLPVKWVIVSDGSTDGTDDIVKKYAAKHHWIDLVRMPERKERHFAGKVHAFNAGYARIRQLDYDIIGNLDADISFDDPDYFDFLLKKFIHLPKLGVAGTPFSEEARHYNYRFTNIEHVSGACQLFRRQCFEEVGGYNPIKIGGIDLVAILKARMNGWQTRTFPEKTCIHHRKMGAGMQSGLTDFFRWGQGDYMLGGHPIWEIFRSIYQMKNKPYIMGGGLRLVGFYWAILTRVGKCVPDELVAYRRKEQMHRLKEFFIGLFSQGKI